MLCKINIIWMSFSRKLLYYYVLDIVVCAIYMIEINKIITIIKKKIIIYYQYMYYKSSV